MDRSKIMLQRALDRYSRRRYPRGEDCNVLRQSVKRIYPKLPPFVPREPDLWMYNESPVIVDPPTIMSKVLGKRFIEHCIVLDLNWLRFVKPEKQIDVRRPQLRRLRINEHETMLDLWQDAQDEVTEFNFEFGDYCVDDTITRPHQLGDEVEWVRKSSDDLSELYDEPEEDRPHLRMRRDEQTGQYVFSPIQTMERADGDCRWQAPSNDEWEMWQDRGKWVYEPDENRRTACQSDGLVVEGRWVFYPIQFFE